jgi:hypothetical protein
MDHTARGHPSRLAEDGEHLRMTKALIDLAFQANAQLGSSKHKTK